MPLRPRLAASLRVFAAVCALSVTASAQPRAATKLDPNALRAVRTGLVGPLHRALPVPGRATVLVEMDGVVDPAGISEIEKTGARVARAAGKPLTYGRFAVADVDEPAALALAAHPRVVRVLH